MKSLWNALRKRCRFFKYKAATYKISQDDIQDDGINKPKKLHQIGVNSYYKPAISIFLPNLNGGGAEKNILTLLEYFVKQNISVDLVCTSHYGALREKVPRGVRYIVLDSGRVILSIPRYISYLALARPQVVLSTLERANIVACIGKLLSSNKHKLVLRIENSIFEPTIRPREIGRIFWILLIVLFYRFADEYICISHGLKRQMESLFKNRCNNISTI